MRENTIATAIAGHVRAHFEAYSAVLGSVSYVKEACAESSVKARKRRDAHGDVRGRNTPIQQSAAGRLLPFVESGVITLVGATTENPSFEVIGPLLSRCKTLVLKPLDEDCIRRIIIRAVADEKKRSGRNRNKT
jgi:putative ATPase